MVNTSRAGPKMQWKSAPRRVSPGSLCADEYTHALSICFLLCPRLLSLWWISKFAGVDKYGFGSIVRKLAAGRALASTLFNLGLLFWTMEYFQPCCHQARFPVPYFNAFHTQRQTIFLLSSLPASFVLQSDLFPRAQSTKRFFCLLAITSHQYLFLSASYFILKRVFSQIFHTLVVVCLTINQQQELLNDLSFTQQLLCPLVWWHRTRSHLQTEMHS